MSHFTVTVALPGELDADATKLNEALEAVLEPYREGEVERYQKYTKAELVAKGRESIETYKNGLYAEYLKDPEKYAEGCHNQPHLDYLRGTNEEGGFPAKLTWTDEQVYADELRWYGPEDIGPDGEVYSTYNPQSEWDWYSIGGRWCGHWTLKVDENGTVADGPLDTYVSWGIGPEDLPKEHQTDNARVKDIGPETLQPTFAFVNLDGEWIERGDMGWWGITSDEMDQKDWDKQYSNWVSSLPKDTWLVLVDAHI